LRLRIVPFHTPLGNLLAQKIDPFLLHALIQFS